MTLYHGTNRLDLMRFDMSHVEPFNIDLHFGTEAAARNRIDYLQNEMLDLTHFEITDTVEYHRECADFLEGTTCYFETAVIQSGESYEPTSQ